MPIFSQTYGRFDPPSGFPANLPISGIDDILMPIDFIDIAGTVTKNHATAYTSQPIWISSDYADDYIYNRVWVTPALTEFGILTAPQTTDVFIWNAQGFNVSFSSVAESGTDGFTLNIPALPYTVLSGGELSFTVDASLAGPAVIDATYTLTIDADGYGVSFKGQRAIPFTLRPSVPSTERWSWSTQIMTSYDTSEQRIMLRDEPRISLSNSYQAKTPYESAILTNLMLGGIGNYFTVPSWHEQKHLTTQVTASDTEIFVDTRYADFQTGWKTMLWNSTTSFEIVNVLTVNDSSLELATPVIGNFSIDTLVLPIQFGVVKDKIQHKSKTMSLGSGQFEFMFEGTAIPDDGDYTPTTTYQGYNVLEGVNYCFSDNSASQDVVRPMVFFDNGQGKFEIENKNESNLNNTLGFFSQELSEIWDIKTFLATLKGRLKPFWALTWTRDIEVIGSYSSVETVLTILPVFYSLFFSDSTNRRDIAFVKKDGTKMYRRIIASTDTTITIDSALGFDFDMTDFRMICFINLVRQASDDINFEWTQAGRVQISIPVTGVDA